MEKSKPIGVFDSGVGGLSILRALRAELPQEDFVYFSDAAHAPYGERGDPYVVERSRAIAAQLLDQHRIKALVVACNTATAAAVHLLRAEHDCIPTVGVEPALKPAAALTGTGRVAVFATRGTLASEKFAKLHDSLRDQAEFVLVPCDGLALAIESFNEDEVANLCRLYVEGAGEFGHLPGQIDTLVLGCTHYPFAAAEFERLVGPGVRLVETGEPVARQTRRLLEAKSLLNERGQAGVEWMSSGPMPQLRDAAARWLSL